VLAVLPAALRTGSVLPVAIHLVPFELRNGPNRTPPRRNLQQLQRRAKIGYVIGRRRRHWKGERHIVCTRLPVDLFDRATQRAQDTQQSMNDYLLSLVQRDVDRETKP
jgi:hypothetical protein